MCVCVGVCVEEEREGGRDGKGVPGNARPFGHCRGGSLESAPGREGGREGGRARAYLATQSLLDIAGSGAYNLLKERSDSYF